MPGEAAKVPGKQTLTTFFQRPAQQSSACASTSTDTDPDDVVFVDPPPEQTTEDQAPPQQAPPTMMSKEHARAFDDVLKLCELQSADFSPLYQVHSLGEAASAFMNAHRVHDAFHKLHRTNAILQA